MILYASWRRLINMLFKKEEEAPTVAHKTSLPTLISYKLLEDSDAACYFADGVFTGEEELDILYLDFDGLCSFSELLEINSIEFYRTLAENDFRYKDEFGRKLIVSCAYCLMDKYDLDANSIGTLYEKSNNMFFEFDEVLSDAVKAESGETQDSEEN